MKKLLVLLMSVLVRNELTRAVNEAPPSLVHLTNAVNAELGGAEGEWLKIKFGVYPNQVGLQVFDRAGAEKMVTAFNSLAERYATLFRGQPIYVGHPDDADWRRANPGIPEAAVGRVTALKIGDDGLLLRRAFNDEGKRLTAGEAPAYTAFSPHWGMEATTHQGRKAFRPVHLFSVGLCNRPQIPGTFIGLNEALPTETSNPSMKLKIIALLAALGRPAPAADVTDAALETALNEALPVATQFVADAGKLTTATNEATTAQGEVSTLKTKLETATNEATTLRTQLATERSARAEAVLVTAINEGRLTAAQKPEWLAKFTADGADFAAIEGELKLKKAINTKSQADIGGRRSGAVASKSKITAINEAIAAKCTAMNTTDRNTAYLALVREGHELFKNEVAAE
jgi:hypothetical protein